MDGTGLKQEVSWRKGGLIFRTRYSQEVVARSNVIPGDTPPNSWICVNACAAQLMEGTRKICRAPFRYEYSPIGHIVKDTHGDNVRYTRVR